MFLPVDAFQFAELDTSVNVKWRVKTGGGATNDDFLVLNEKKKKNQFHIVVTIVGVVIGSNKIRKLICVSTGQLSSQMYDTEQRQFLDGVVVRRRIFFRSVLCY